MRIFWEGYSDVTYRPNELESMENERISKLLNELLNEIKASRKENEAIIDQMDPTYKNVRNIHRMVNDIQEEHSTINGRLSQIEGQLQQLLNNLR